MGRSQETFNKKEVRKKKEKKRKDKVEKKLARKDKEKKSMDDMIAYVDAEGNITSTPPVPGKKDEINAEDIEVSTAKLTDEDRKVTARKGRLNFFNDSKGFGFITDMNTRESIFVHINNMVDDIREGDVVTFEVEKGKKGLAATMVRKA